MKSIYVLVVWPERKWIRGDAVLEMLAAQIRAGLASADAATNDPARAAMYLDRLGCVVVAREPRR